MGAAIQAGIDLLDDRKQQYKDNGIGFYRPWLMLITDGAPTDEWQAAAARVHAGEADKKFSFYAIAVEGADMEMLKRIAPPTRAPLSLQRLQFKELFSWLSSSLQAVSRSKAGEAVPLQDPTVGNGWASHG